MLCPGSETDIVVDEGYKRMDTASKSSSVLQPVGYHRVTYLPGAPCAIDATIKKCN